VVAHRDVRLIDRDGYLFVKGRAKEFINRGGTKISPQEIEEVLSDHPNVAEAVVFATPESRLGEEVTAAVVLRRSKPTAATEIREFASRRLSYFKMPRQIVLLDEIPRGPTGKPQRVGLAAKLGLIAPRKEHWENSITRGPHTQLEVVLTMMWEHIIGTERVGLYDDFFEIGGDSLAAMELIAGIEQVTGQSLTIAALFQAPTIKELAAFIQQSGSGGQPYIVPIRSMGNQLPFFCVDAGPRYLNLARRLSTDQPIIGLLHPNAISNSIEAMAEFSVKSIRAVQPHGPYFIAGWCTAGLVASKSPSSFGRRVKKLRCWSYSMQSTPPGWTGCLSWAQCSCKPTNSAERFGFICVR
jgi:oxalate---CoA ligase